MNFENLPQVNYADMQKINTRYSVQTRGIMSYMSHVHEVSYHNARLKPENGRSETDSPVYYREPVCASNEVLWSGDPLRTSLTCQLYIPVDGCMQRYGEVEDIPFKLSGHSTGLVNVVDPRQGEGVLFITAHPLLGVTHNKLPAAVEATTFKSVYDWVSQSQVAVPFAEITERFGYHYSTCLIRPSRLTAEDLPDIPIPTIEAPINLAEYFYHANLIKSVYLKLAARYFPDRVNRFISGYTEAARKELLEALNV